MDYLTKWPEARAVPKATAEETVKFIYEDIICRYGCPQKILSDRGTHFNNQLVNELMKRFEIKHLLSTPYHPQTNGLVERFNRSLCESLAKLVEKTDEWDKFIAPVLFAYRISKHSTTKITPFYLTYGREAVLPIDDLTENEEQIITRIHKLIDDLPHVRELTKNRIDQQQSKQKEYHDKNVRHEINFKIGDKVLLYKAEKEKQWTRKLDEKWKGPYYIHEVLLNGAYKIKELNGKVLKTPVNGEWLKVYHSRENFEPMVVIN